MFSFAMLQTRPRRIVTRMRNPRYERRRWSSCPIFSPEPGPYDLEKRAAGNLVKKRTPLQERIESLGLSRLFGGKIARKELEAIAGADKR